MTRSAPHRPRHCRGRRPAGRSGAALLALGLAVGVAACSNDGPTAPDPCSSPATFIIGEGPRPTFSWVPACPASQFVVTDSGGFLVWRRTTGGTNAITPPVWYPDQETDPANGSAAPLAPGRRYRVYAWRTIPRQTLCLDFLFVCGAAVVADSEFVR